MTTTRKPEDTIGKRIALARLRAGATRGRLYTQTELARTVGVTPGTVSQYEADASEPALAMIQKLADALWVEPGYLAFGTTQQQAAPAEPRASDVAGARVRNQSKRNAAKEPGKKASGAGQSGRARRPKPQ